MKLEQFKQSPMSIMHEAYSSGFFHLSRAPENASGEVILASLYRATGFKIGEGQVTQAGKSFLARLDSGEKTNPELQTGIGENVWKFILERILESPKQPSQPKKKFIQLTPLVPDTALYSFAARYMGNPWNPGALTASIIQYGCNTPIVTEDTWKEIFKALDIDETDDIWARLLSQEFGVWRDGGNTWGINTYDEVCALERKDRMRYHIPAKRFVKDIRSLIALKKSLTRRQWISLIESLVRLGTASHVLWICDVNKRIWQLFRQSLNGGSPPGIHEIGETIMPVKNGFWRYGESAAPILKEKARDYITARVGINYVISFVDDLIQSGTLGSTKLQFRMVEDIHRICTYLFENRAFLPIDIILEETTQFLEENPKLLTCSKGITSNLFEFLRYSLGQRQTVDPEARNYDQGYWIKKKGNYSSAPWILAAGPVSLMTMAYCCAQESSAPRTIDDFCRHIGQYGITLEPGELSTNGLSQSLRNLGIVIDSPDAEGGMVVLNPFKNVVTNS
jgi:hypothetical protein